MTALTVYGADGTPVAWAGRPSELLADRLQGREAWFPTPVAQGLRLVYVQPLTSNGYSRRHDCRGTAAAIHRRLRNGHEQPSRHRLGRVSHTDDASAGVDPVAVRRHAAGR